MRLHRLRVVDFGAIRDTDIEFGPGLNVLYGPNDLGKSTLAEAIRLALLLPHTSTHIEEYRPWTGGHDPFVEITFETEPQRIWRVKKEFRKTGTSLLQESKNGVDFVDSERARKVDGKLRDLLGWGISEPGGLASSKGLPKSFLATVLLSTQSDVASVLKASLQADPSVTGKERIAAALQAVAQDPLFTALLRAAQARRDEAYTDTGAKKTAKGSVFRAAADRLNQVRKEKEEFQTAVDDSEGIEKQLRDYSLRRDQCGEAVATTTELLATLEGLATQSASLAEAEEQLRLAREEVQRIHTISIDVESGERIVGDLALKMEAAEQALKISLAQQEEAENAVNLAEDAARTADPGATDTVIRQALELRKVTADQALRDAQLEIDRATTALQLVDAATSAEHEHRMQLANADIARQALADATADELAKNEELRKLDILERALDARAADERASLAQADVDKDSALRAQRVVDVAEREALERQRAAIVVPSADALRPMRRLDSDLAAARGALNVGFMVTVTPNRPIDIRVKKDGAAANSAPTSEPFDVEANTEVDVDIGDVATVRIRGGRREAQQRVESLESRWSSEVGLHLSAANVADLEGLSAKIAEAEQLETRAKAKDQELQSLAGQIALLADSQERLRVALDRRTACQAVLGNVPLETFASDIAALGADATRTLRELRQKSTRELELARATASQAGTANALAEERARTSRSALDTAIAVRDAALAAFPDGADANLSMARVALAAALAEQLAVVSEFNSLESMIASHGARVEEAIRDARAAAEQARDRVHAAEEQRKKAIIDHAAQVGRLGQLRVSRDSQDLVAAENRLRDASGKHASLPAPIRAVTEAEITAAQSAKTMAISELAAIEREIDRTHGALEQVGGAVARERLGDAIDAFELADRHEREIEADYEAWLLLLEQMKLADAAQASNLGQVLAPAIARQFEALTQRRYANVRLSAQLDTEGVVVAGAVRSIERISVGTREQLSTLYRLALAEYLHTTVVLDDQLVQSDDTRLDWFRAMLREKAHSFQIIVFTCRPGDYLGADAMVPEGEAVYKDTDGGFIRAVDVGRAMAG